MLIRPAKLMISTIVPMMASRTMRMRSRSVASSTNTRTNTTALVMAKCPQAAREKLKNTPTINTP